MNFKPAVEEIQQQNVTATTRNQFAASSPLTQPARLSLTRSSCGRYNRYDCVWLWQNDPKYHDEPGDENIPVRVVEFLPAVGVMPERVVVVTPRGSGITVPLRQVAGHMSRDQVIEAFGAHERSA